MGDGFRRVGRAGRPGVTRPFVIGVTGGIASGKSTVLSVLAELGAEVIDADLVYHDLIAPGSPLNGALQRAFGTAIGRPDGTIDRAELGRTVFRDPVALARLDALTHPAVDVEIERRIEASRAQVLAVDAVKLIESGLNRLCDQVWLVRVERATQIDRLAARNGIPQPAAAMRVDAHRILADCADVVIDNDGSPEVTRARVRELWHDVLPLSIGE